MGSNTSLSQLLTDAWLMAEGIKKRMDTMVKVGIDEVRVSGIEVPPSRSPRSTPSRRSSSRS